jgi:ubiquinone/menaquinone biosynthesis C-methylase UbiE
MRTRGLTLLVVLVLGACSAERSQAPAPASTPTTTPSASAATSAPLVHRFEHADQWAKQFDDPARNAWQKPADVIAAMKITAGMTVADIGAGTGYFEPWLSRAVGPTGKVLALDVEPDMVRYITERAAREHLANVTASQVAIDDPQLPKGKVDRILIVDTWHHIPSREAYAAKLRDALSAEGSITIVDFTKASPHGPPPQHRLTPEQVVGELRTTGLSAGVVPSSLPDQYIVSARLP